MVIGVVAVLLGIIGFVSHPILGIFGVNTYQNILHLAVGALGLWLGMKGSAKGFNMWLGIVAALVGVLWFIPGTGGDSGLLASLLGINAATSYLHLGIAVVSLLIAFLVKGSQAQAAAA